MIPGDLPPTTAPCPHCGGVITSPELELEPELKIPDALVPDFQPPPPPPEIPPTPVSEELEKPPAKEPLPEPVPLPEKSEPEASKPKGSRLIPAILILFALLLLGLGGAYYILPKMSQELAPPANPKISGEPKTNPANSIRMDWQKEAYQVLRGYMAATRDKDKAPFILNGSELTTQLEGFYAGAVINDSDTPADAFSIYELSEEDHKRGLFMMVYDQPPQAKTKKLLPPPANNNLAMESRTIYAFFKRTPDGLKLDWEIFAQTKYRTLQNFVAQRKIGQSKVFRVFIVEDVPDKGRPPAGTRTYRVTDPANTGDTARVNVKVDSEIGRSLSSINWHGSKENRPITGTATVELKWGGEPTSPELTISRFVCWEFLGLGVNQPPSPAAAK